uniref:TCF3 fusion partner n=1 Tax=Myotis myotis TaxID=51298 RepID=A0A7J7Z4E1_MYOMY|nr:hypothetical protein mMyoMyo1_010466 [Myotis myotis]
MELEQREGSMAAVGFEEFSAPPGWELVLPLLKRITRRLQQERRFLMRVLDSYGDNYWASQFTILLEDEGSQSTDAPTPGNAENEPPEKEGLSPPRRTPAPTEASSLAPGKGPSGWKRRRVAPEEGREGVPLTLELAPVQIKVEEDWLQSGRGSGLKLGFSGA